MHTKLGSLSGPRGAAAMNRATGTVARCAVGVRTARTRALVSPPRDMSVPEVIAEMLQPLDEPEEKMRHVAAEMIQKPIENIERRVANFEAACAKFTTEVQKMQEELTAKTDSVLSQRDATPAETISTKDVARVTPSAAVPPYDFENAHRGDLEPARTTVDEDRRQALQQAIDAGYNPASDILAFAKQEEIEAIDRLARWQSDRGLPLSVVPIASDKNRDLLAAEGALRERAHYFAHCPSKRTRTVAWIREGWELDEKSEIDLLRQVYARIRERLRIPKRSG